MKRAQQSRDPVSAIMCGEFEEESAVARVTKAVQVQPLGGGGCGKTRGATTGRNGSRGGGGLGRKWNRVSADKWNKFVGGSARDCRSAAPHQEQWTGHLKLKCGCILSGSRGGLAPPAPALPFQSKLCNFISNKLALQRAFLPLPKEPLHISRPCQCQPPPPSPPATTPALSSETLA